MKNKLLFLFSVLLFSILILNFASATISYVNPKVGTNQSANFLLNFTFANATDGMTDPLSANTTIYWNGTGSWVAVTKSGFECTSGTGCSATLTISSMGDGKGRINITLGNATTLYSFLQANHSPLFRVDKGNPTVSITATPSATYTVQKGNVVLNWTANDTSGSGIRSTSVSVTAEGDNGCYIDAISYTDAQSQVTLTDTQTQCAGLYTATISATDDAGLTSGSSSTTFNIYYPSSQSPSSGGSGSISIGGQPQLTTQQMVQTGVTGQVSFAEKIKLFFTGIIDRIRNLFR